MIINVNKKNDIIRNWKAIKVLCQGSHRQYLVPGCGYTNETPLDQHYNLPLVLAYSVLEETLKQLELEGILAPTPRRAGLEKRMIFSQSNLTWQNYPKVDAGRDARNDLAHEAKLATKQECLEFIEAIEVELKTWGIL